MQQIDSSLFHIVNLGLGRPSLDALFTFITTFGIGAASAGIGLVCVLVGFIRMNVNLRMAGYTGIISVILAGLLSQVGKHMWDRPRPIMVLHDVRWVGQPLFVHSFPSGHTTTAFAFATAIGILYPRARWILYPLATLVGISRIYLGAHFPLDVLGGAVLGIFSGLLAGRILKKKRMAIVDNQLNMGTAC